MYIKEKRPEEVEKNTDKVTVEVRFYKVPDLQKMLGWSETTVLKLFNDPNFPSADFGKGKVVEEHALIEYFSTKHVKIRERYWRT